MRGLLFLVMLFVWSSVNADGVLLKCVAKNGVVTFTKTIRKGDSCTPVPLKDGSNSDVQPVDESKAKAPPSNPDFVLMCQEMEYTDFRLLDPKWANERASLMRYMTARNERPKRPYFALKYVDNKLSYNQEGNVFLDDDVPEMPNGYGWVGSIAIREDSISFELKDTRIESPRMRTVVRIDRYTGLYKTLQFAPGKDEADDMATGKCEKYDQKLF